MVIRSVRHRGLRRLIEDDNPRFLQPQLAGRIRRILTVLLLADDMDEFLSTAPAGWRVHRLSGERQEEWSVSVSGNYRLTFEERNSYIDRLNVEDYH